jgi:hypothetical protein
MGYFSDYALNPRPAGCTQNQDADLSLRQILLVLEVLIGRDQQFKPLVLSLLQKFAIFQTPPTQFMRSRNVVRRKKLA